MISIIIPAHNERYNLTQLFEHFRAGSPKEPYEVIVVLSATTEDGSAVLEPPKVVRILRCAEQGRAVQMNMGAQWAKGDILVFLHADVRPPEGFLRDIEKAIDGGFDAGFFSYRFDKPDFFLKINASFTARDGWFTGGGDQCLFIKRSQFERLGQFDENQVLMEDFEFFDRMKKHRINYTIVKNDLIVSARKYNDNSYARVNLSNLLLVLLYKCGCPPERLKRVHDRLLRIPGHNPS